MDDKLRSLYVDAPPWAPPIKIDDFIVAVGKRKSNSVYHVFSVKVAQRTNTRLVRHNLKVFKSDLNTALRRDKEQMLIPMRWYGRDKKQQ